MRPASRRVAVGLALVAAALGTAVPSRAHDYKAGDLRIDHPYATVVPGAPGTPDRVGLHFRAIENRGPHPDRLLGASSPAAARIALVRAGPTGAPETVDAIDLPARSKTSLRHGGPWRLVLVEPTPGLSVDDDFEVTLRFERAGERRVSVLIVAPTGAASAPSGTSAATATRSAGPAR